MEALGLVVDEALNVPNHEIGIEVAAVVKLDALAQLDQPSLVVGGIDRPLGGEAWRQRSFSVGPREVPIDQCIIERPADEPVSLEPLIGLARPVWDVSRGHGDAQDGLGASLDMHRARELD